MVKGARPLSQVSRLARYKVAIITADGEVTDLGAMSKRAAKDQIDAIQPGEGMTIERAGPDDR